MKIKELAEHCKTVTSTCIKCKYISECAIFSVMMDFATPAYIVKFVEKNMEIEEM